MKKFETPEMEVVELLVEDVVTTSTGGEGGGDDWNTGDEEM